MGSEQEFDRSTAESDPLALAVGALEALAAQDVGGWSTDAVGSSAVAVLGLGERARAVAVLRLGRFLATGGHVRDGSRGAVSWLVARSGLARPDAVGLVRAARLCHRFGLVAGVLQAGEVGLCRVARLARAAVGRSGLFARDEALLVELARTLDDADFEDAVATWEGYADDVLDRGDPSHRHARRGLRLAETTGGTRITGFLPAGVDAVVRRALDDLAPPDPVGCAGGPRSLAQRRADAFVELAHRHLAGRNHAAGGPVATVDVTVDADVLVAHAGRHHHQGAPMAVPVPLPLSLEALLRPRCHVDGRPAPVSVVERFLCESWAGRLVMDADGEPLDAGRRRRTFTAAQRRAITVRDRHCQFPGCDLDADWCDVHHLHPWEVGGGTDLDNGVLVCRRHHTVVHDQRWQVGRSPDGRPVLQPP